MIVVSEYLRVLIYYSEKDNLSIYSDEHVTFQKFKAHAHHDYKKLHMNEDTSSGQLVQTFIEMLFLTLPEYINNILETSDKPNGKKLPQELFKESVEGTRVLTYIESSGLFSFAPTCSTFLPEEWTPSYILETEEIAMQYLAEQYSAFL